MVNASLNWASIVGIVLAVGGAFLYFMRNFKPALARDYDVFFAAVGLLCGGILFFQGWRLDPILQFGQFLLAGTTVFFAYESVRLRGITTEQARRSSFFDDDEPEPLRARRGDFGRDWEAEREIDRFEDQDSIRRRIPSREEEEDFYRPRRSSRAAIPEQAASRLGGRSEDWESEPRPGSFPDSRDGARYRPVSSPRSSSQEFGDRRRDRNGPEEPRRGSRPSAAVDPITRSNRRSAPPKPSGAPGLSSKGVPEGTPLRGQPKAANDVSDADYSPLSAPPPSPRTRPEAPAAPPASSRDPRSSRSPSSRDNSSRFDD